VGPAPSPLAITTVGPAPSPLATAVPVVAGTPPASHPSADGLVVFLDRDGRTRRAVVAPAAADYSTLRRLLIDRFDGAPLDPSAVIYIRDPAGTVAGTRAQPVVM
jgi:hypothetical protein